MRAMMPRRRRSTRRSIGSGGKTEVLSISPVGRIWSKYAVESEIDLTWTLRPSADTSSSGAYLAPAGLYRNNREAGVAPAALRQISSGGVT